MNFKEVLKTIAKRFAEQRIDFALIGAFALLKCGIERATRDIDFLILVKDIDRVKKIMDDLTYKPIQITKTFSQFESPLEPFGNVDFLQVSGDVGKQILKDAEREKFLDTELKIVSPEDLIGLKVLAYANDPSREERDKSDIQLLHKAHSDGKIKLDLEKIKSYYLMFDKVKDFYGLWLKDKNYG